MGNPGFNMTEEEKKQKEPGQISRREFSEDAGALSPKPAGQQRPVKLAYKMPVKVAPSKGVLVVDEEHCTTCMQCMHVCALIKEGVGSHELALIQMSAHTFYIFDNSAKPCLQCVDPQCLRYCPTGAIKLDAETGARVIDQACCMGCQTCIQSCPYNPPRIRFDSIRKKAKKCDLCGGDPECVKVCPTGALKYYTHPAGVQSGYIQPKGSN